MARNWKECSPRHPCEICGSQNWCSFTKDGGMRKCRKLLSDSVRSDTLGEYSLYPTGDTPMPIPRREEPEPPCASPEEISAALQIMLDALPLRDNHIENLLSRGLSREWIEIAGYRSYNSFTDRKTVIAALWPYHKWDLLRFPGFYRTHEGKIDIACLSGLLVPVRNHQGEIAAMRIRLDEPMDGTKYIWMSSAGHGGPSSKSHCHVSLGEVRDEVIRVTEGELKADVCTLRTGILTVSVPGATNVSKLIDTIRPLCCKRVILAWDADKRDKKMNQGRPVNHVARGLQMAAIHLANAGYEVFLEDWDKSVGKGIDDVIASGHRDAVTLYSGASVWRFIEDLMREVGYEPAPEISARACRVEAVSAPEVRIETKAEPVSTPQKPKAERRQKHEAPAPEPMLPAPEPMLPAPEAEFPPLNEAVFGPEPPQAPPPVRSAPRMSGGHGPRMLARGDAVELSQLLIEDLTTMGGGVVPVYDMGQFWIWEDNKWIEYKSARLRNMISTYAGLPVQGAKGPKPLSVSASLAEGAILFASSACDAEGFFHEAPFGIPFRNGFMALEGHSLVLQDHSPQRRQRYVLDFDYDANATAPLWDKFLTEVFAASANEEDLEARKAVFMEAIGASLMGLGPKYQRAFILLGSGSNGKSTAMNVLEHLFPPHVVASVQPKLFVRAVNRAELAHKMVNIVSEISHNELQDTSDLKAIVTGESISTEKKYKDPCNVRCKATHFYAANDLPETRDLSDGFFRRFIILLFDRKFAEHEKDENLTEKLLADRAGIANLAIAHMLGLVKRGHYTIPESSREKAIAWREENDQVMRFVNEVCIQTPDFDTPIGVLYEAYKKWASAKGVGLLAERKLSSKLIEMGHYKAMTLARRYNLALRDEVVKAMESAYRAHRRSVN